MSKKVHVSRETIFDEQAQWDWSKSGDRGETMGNDDMFKVDMEYSTVVQGAPVAADVPDGVVVQSPHGSPVPASLSPVPAPDA
jgi:hypothetical protein